MSALTKSSQDILNSTFDISQKAQTSYTTVIKTGKATHLHPIASIDKLKTFFIKISKQELKEAVKMGKANAARFYFDVMTKELGIPKELKPNFVIKKNIDVEHNGTYEFWSNQLTYYPNSKSNKKFGHWWTFGVIRFELENVAQTIEILRNKDLSQTFIDEIVKRLAKKNFKKAIETKQELEAFRYKILKYYPESSKRSKNYKKVKQYFLNQFNSSAQKCNKIEEFEYFKQPIKFDTCKILASNVLNYFITRIIG